MISLFRKLFSSKIGTAIALLFVVLMGLAFALGDVTGSSTFGGVGGSNVAQVGDARITTAELAGAVDNAHQGARQERPNLDRATFVSQGGLDATLTRLISGYAIAEFARMAGLGVSKAMIDEQIRSMGIGRGPDGNFSEDAFRAVLASNNVSEAALRADIGRTLFAEQLLTPVSAGNFAPRGLVLPYAGLTLERRSGAVALIPAVAFLPAQPPADAVLAGWLKQRASRFLVPEQRVIAYALFDSSVLGARGTPTEAEIAQYYRANAAQYAETETRDIAHVVAPTEAAARALADRAKGGATLAAAASAVGLAVVDSDDQSRAAYAGLAGDAVAQAAFGATEGAVAGPAKGALGWYVVSVKNVARQAARPIEAARGEIADRLASEKRASAMAELTGEMEDALIGGTSLQEVAAANRLPVQRTPLVVGDGRNPKDPKFKPDPALARIIATGFQIGEGEEAQLIEVERGAKFALVAVERVVPAATPPLAEIKPLVLRGWALEQGAARAKAAAEAIRKSVAGGKSLAEAVSAFPTKLPPPRTVAGSRGELTQQGRRTPPPVALMFSLPQGAVRTLEATGDQGWYVVSLTEVVAGDASGNPALVEAARREFGRILPDEYVRQFARAVETHVGVERNEGAIRTVREQFVPATTPQ